MNDANSSSMKICFVIAPIGEDKSETRERSDKVLRHIIQPAATQCGYTIERADRISKPGIITSQIIQHIVEDALVIADLTDHNPNVFYELAIRHAIKKPVVQIIKNGQSIPFDLSATRTIKVDHTDLDSADNARKEIIRQISAVELNPDAVDSPISAALDLQSLRQSDKPLEKGMADIIRIVEGLKMAIADLRNDRQHFGNARQGHLGYGYHPGLNYGAVLGDPIYYPGVSFDSELGKGGVIFLNDHQDSVELRKNEVPSESAEAPKEHKSRDKEEK